MKRELPRVLMLASVASMIGQFNMQNIRLLQELGYEVHVACNFEKGNTFGKEHSDRLWQTLGDMHVVQHQWDCPRSITSAAKCLRAFKQLWELTGRYYFEWIHCHSPIGGALARVSAHLRKIRVIYTAHGFHFYIGAPVKNWLLYYPVEKLLAYWTDVLITVNREDYRFAKQNMKTKKVCYIPGIGIECSRFLSMAGKKQSHDRLCSRYHIPQDAVVLLSVGELNKGKNHQIVISALAGLLRQDVYYLICGQGSLKKDLQRYAEALGVGSRLRMPGYQEDMAQIYQGADIFVFPSLREGMPVALMEAMAAGLPCIVSDVRGNRELIGGAKMGSGAIELIRKADMCSRAHGMNREADMCSRAHGMNREAGMCSRVHGMNREAGMCSRAHGLSSEAEMRGRYFELKNMCADSGGLRYEPDNYRQLQKSLELLLEDKQLRAECGMRNQSKILGCDSAVVEKRMKKIYGCCSDRLTGTAYGKVQGNLQDRNVKKQPAAGSSILVCGNDTGRT